MTTVAASTPKYVLIDGNLPIGPNVVPLEGGIECLAIYGFSNKDRYDKFCANSQLALRPYPLVKGYLRNQIDVPGDSFKLVMIDATSPSEPHLHAATIAAVLDAQESHSVHVTTAHRLTFNEHVNAYRVDEQCNNEKEQLDESHA